MATSTPEDQAAALWVSAYDRLRRSETMLVRSYESLVVPSWLESQVPPRLARRPSVVEISGADAVGSALYRVAAMMLDETEATQHGGGDRRNSLKKLLQGRLRASPHASIAWVTAYITLDVSSLSCLLPVIGAKAVTLTGSPFRVTEPASNLLEPSHRSVSHLTQLAVRVVRWAVQALLLAEPCPTHFGFLKPFRQLPGWPIRGSSCVSDACCVPNTGV